MRSPSRRTTAWARTATQNFTLTVNEAPAITSASSATFLVGVAGHLHGDHHRLPGGATLTLAAARCRRRHLHRQRQRHRDAGRHAAARHGRRLPADLHRDQRHRRGRGPELHAHRRTRRRRFTSAASTTFAGRHRGHLHGHDDRRPAGTGITVTGALPAGVTFADNGNGTATLTGTPGAGTGGSLPAHLHGQQRRGARNVVQNFTLTVHQAPAITSADQRRRSSSARRHLHGHDDRLPGAGDHASAATRCQRA